MLYTMLYWSGEYTSQSWQILSNSTQYRPLICCNTVVLILMYIASLCSLPLTNSTSILCFNVQRPATLSEMIIKISCVSHLSSVLCYSEAVWVALGQQREAKSWGKEAGPCCPQADLPCGNRHAGEPALAAGGVCWVCMLHVQTKG